jgi:hypothetical protein
VTSAYSLMHFGVAKVVFLPLLAGETSKCNSPSLTGKKWRKQVSSRRRARVLDDASSLLDQMRDSGADSWWLAVNSDSRFMSSYPNLSWAEGLHMDRDEFDQLARDERLAHRHGQGFCPGPPAKKKPSQHLPRRARDIDTGAILFGTSTHKILAHLQKKKKK